jgi:fumarylacetoacetase
VIALPDETHRGDLVSWIESAQDAASDFPLQNLPLGLFRTDSGTPRPGIAIGDSVLDLAAAAQAELFDAQSAQLIERSIAEGALNPLLGAGRGALSTLRHAASRLLRADTPDGARARRLGEGIVRSRHDVEPVLPARVADYTDFYASIHHATNVGSMFRPDNPLLPNYKWVPIGYHGRASSLVPSGTPVRRPQGQTRADGAESPAFGPSRRLDYEMEVGAYVATGNALGQPIALRDAEAHVAGLCLVNDWSARDVQAWEYQPLGPFLAKSFATTVSPWIVTLDALAPFRVPVAERDARDPPPLPYLSDPANDRAGAIAIALEVLLSSSEMRRRGHAPMRISLGSFTSMYWTIAQLVTHHASNGCNLRTGDLLASGTVSGATKESRGCLLERTWKGTEPLLLPTGEERRFLEDGDEVTMRGWCERSGYRRIGFGECRGIVTPATSEQR